MDFASQVRGKFLIIEFKTPRATVDLAPAFKEKMIGEIDDGQLNIILNLNYVEFVDSSFLGALIASLKHSKANNGQILVAGLHPHVRMTFELTRLDKLFMVFSTVEQAMSHI